jgi:zinc transport system substrate-binding protein
MKKYFLFFFLSLVLVSCGGGNKSVSNKRIITVTIEPLRYFTEQIAGDKFDVVAMVPKGSNPETYEPTAKQMVDLSESDLYIKVGNIGFERTWMKRLQANAPHAIVIDSSEGIDYIIGRHKAKDPHTWMSTTNASIIANNIYKILAEVDNKDSIFFKQNLKNLLTKIQNIDTRIRENLTKDKSNAFLVYHPTLSYFARDYGLKQITIEEEGREPSPASLEKVISIARADNVKTIFTQKEFSDSNIKLVKESLNSETVEINPLSYHWDKEMLKVAEKLR